MTQGLLVGKLLVGGLGVYPDEESSMRSAKMIIFPSENEIKSVQTTTHAHTVEGFIIAFKDNLYRILDSSNEDKTKWITPKYNIIFKRNNIIQLSIALPKPSLRKLGKKQTTFGLTGIFIIQPKRIEHTLI